MKVTATILFTCIIALNVMVWWQISKINAMQDELIEVDTEVIESNKELIETIEKLLIHKLINIRQNDIIDKFQSSRKAKLEDKELMELQSKLN